MTAADFDRFPEAVQQAIDAGLAVVPASLDKVPAVKWAQWNDAPQTDEDRLWVGHGSLYAVVTGELYGFCVLDFDGPAGIETMHRLGLEPHVETATGAHTYVQWPGHRVRSSAKAFPQYPGLDIKAERSLAFFHGRSKKGAYRQRSWPPQPVTLPPTLAEELFPVLPDRPESSAPEGTWDGPGLGAASAVRYLDKVCRDIRAAVPGGSNAALNKAAFAIGGLIAAGQIDGTAAYEALLNAAEDRGAGDPDVVLTAALSRGTETPWSLDSDPDDDPDWQLSTGERIVLVDAAGTPLHDHADDEEEWDEVLGSLHLTEAALARDAEMEAEADLAARTMNVRQVLFRPSPRWLVPGFLQTGSLSEIIGPPTSGKSLLVLQWSVELALDGKRVLYAAAEGLGGFGLRLRALAKHRGMTLDELADRMDGNLLFYVDGIDLADVEAAEDLVAWTARHAPWDLVVIDTLARAVPGAEENSAKEMGAAVHSAERLKGGEGTVLMVHHSGHGTKRGRGSSAVLAACDSVIHCFPTSEAYNGRGGNPLRVTVTTEKLKDGQASKPQYLQTEVVNLGRTRAGEHMTSVVLVPLSAEEAEEERAEQREAGIEAKVRQALDDGMRWSGKGGARDYWTGEDRKVAKVIWDRLTEQAAA